MRTVIDLEREIDFARIPSIMSIPNLIEVQKTSFEEFLQKDVPPENRKKQGLQAAFLDIFPIVNVDQTLSLEFVEYILEEPKCDKMEAIDKDTTYSLPLKIRVKLVIKKGTRGKPIIKEQSVYLCNFPYMTDTGTFIINGAERVVVNQLHRSPGVIFEEDQEPGTKKIKISSYGKRLYVASIIPYRGAWVEFEFDNNNALFVKIDKKRKLAATVLLKSLGLETNQQILHVFYDTEEIHVKIDNSHSIEKSISPLLGKILASDIVDKKTGEILAEANEQIIPELGKKILRAEIGRVEVVKFDAVINDVAIHETLKRDRIKSQAQAILDIFRRLRAQEYITEESATAFFDTLLFRTIKKYDLSRVGRYKINRKLSPVLEKMRTRLPTAIQEAICRSDYYFGNRESKKLEIPLETKRTLCLQDILATIKYLVDLNNGTGAEVDDIDHLGNRRVRSVGELLENQIRIGLSHMARLVRERMNMQSNETITPRDIINTAPVVGVIRKFFGTSQLSQFMDQTNPLAELTHKRRLSALGPGGLNRKRAGFEVRDVHHSHYGRICPIETPEGPNIGLITTLSLYARINKYGLIETPYRKVVKGRVTDQIEHLTADREDEYVIAQANAPIDAEGRFKKDMVATRCRGDFSLVSPKEIDFMDISPKQLMGASAGLIPFLEHDDANRALMGSNMQRQAVPLLTCEEPLVATGIEEAVAKDSGVVVTAERAGRVESVSADQIIVCCGEEGKNEDRPVDIYHLKKYKRSNQDTCVNQIPVVKVGDHLRKGQVIADGPATCQGRLALGRNVLVAFMSWGGYNFEDAILISERLVRDDVFTSIHIQKFEVDARDLTIGSEEITRDIPNVGEEALKNLDENGIVHIGAYVYLGDILVGKVTPKGESRSTPEERLLRVIFGKKAEEVQDASLRVPPGVEGKVLDVRVFTRKGKISKDGETNILKEIDQKYSKLISDLRQNRKKALASGENLSKEDRKKIDKLTEFQIEELKKNKKKAQESLRQGDDLPVTVNKVVKVFVVSKRKISAGDKLAGRHGNKGVVARILPVADMPFLPDGTPVDIVLNPLSIPSRMNVGQILEAELGWAAHKLGVQMISPIFDGAREEDIRGKLNEAGLPEDSKITLYDGLTGEPMEEKVTVGYMYIIKLAHLVEDKIHARSIGPYSLITRQPLGGKAQFGGQRFGEMEVWAIEGYGAAYTLKEFLTMKSDDVTGRTKMYEAIVKGEPIEEGEVPESFKVLVKELQALGLSVELQK
jgi:DNA-directed RNA polymerase subunit beta